MGTTDVIDSSKGSFDSFINTKNNSKHLAVSVFWDEEKRSEIERLLQNLMKLQLERGISILTLDCSMPEKVLEEFLRFYVKKKVLDEQQIKVSIIGKWYDCSQSTVELIKDLVKSTGEHAQFFLNFVVHYDGQEEIVDACTLLCRQIIAEKLDLEQVTKMKIKENMYTSYFPPPELIIRIGGPARVFGGFLLWDSHHAPLHYTPDYTIEKVLALLP